MINLLPEAGGIIHVSGILIISLLSIFGLLVAYHIPKFRLNKIDVVFFGMWITIFSVIWPIFMIGIPVLGIGYIVIRLMDKFAKWSAKNILTLVELFNSVEQKKE